MSSSIAAHMRRNVVAYLALFFAFTGSAYALSKGEVKSKHIAKNAVKSKHVKDGQIKNKDLANGTVTKQKIASSALADLVGPQGPKGDKGEKGEKGEPGEQGEPGEPGSAVAYARIHSNGSVIASESKGISNANVSKTAGHAYCFSGLGFTPKNIQVTHHYADTDPIVARQVAIVNSNTVSCPGDNEGATVVFYDGTNIFTASQVASGFYVLFQ